MTVPRRGWPWISALTPPTVRGSGSVKRTLRSADSIVPRPPTRRWSILIPVSGVTAVLLLLKLVGFSEKLIVAHYWGTGRTADAYFAALSVVWTLVFILQELIQPAVLPVYIGLTESGRRESAWQLVNLLGVGLSLLLVSAAAALAVCPGQLVSLIAPGFPRETSIQAAGFARAMAAGTGLLAFSALTRAVLNAHQRFCWAAIGDLAFRIAFVSCLAVGLGRWGQGYIGWWLAAGASAGLAVHIWVLRKHVRLCWPVLDADALAAVRQVAVLAAPLIFGVVFSHISQLVDGMLASVLPAGRLSALNYAKKLTDSIVLMGPVALATVLFSRFSSQIAAGKLDEVRTALVRCIHVVLMASLPVSLLVVMLRVPIVALLFQRGRFDAHSTYLTASALGAYGLGIVALSLEGLLVGTFYALKDMKTPVIIGVAGATADIALAWVLMQRLDHTGIALSISIVKSVKVVVLAALLNGRLCLGLGGPLRRAALGLSGAVLTAGFAVAAGAWIWSELGPPSGKLMILCRLGALSALGLGGYASVARISGLFRIDGLNPHLYTDKVE